MGWLKAKIFKEDINRCSMCGNLLSETEKTYYGRTCERCERKSMEKLKKEDMKEDKKWKRKESIMKQRH